MQTKAYFTPFILIVITFCSCCEITGGCPPKSGEVSVLDDSNPKVRLLVVLNNSCKVCNGNYANESFLENKISQTISVTYSYSSVVKQPDGNSTSTPITLTSDIEATKRISIGCSCHEGDFITDIKIVATN